MKELNISTVLINKRKEKGITQDELANYLGVSKAAISKWETSQSYPDITLLPVLAAYFNITLDDLLGYQAQMSKADIKTIYYKLCQEFAVEAFDTVIEHCHVIIKKYYACFPLLFQMGVLILNHAMLAGEQEKIMELTAEARDLFYRIQNEGNDVNLSKQAMNLEALCFITLNEPNAALLLLEDTDKPHTPSGVLLSSAYLMIGEKEKAKSSIQIDIYQNIMNTFGAYPSFLMLYADDEVKFQDCIDRIFALDKAFGIRNMHPGILIPVLIVGAQGYAMQGNKDKALDILQMYAEIVTEFFPFALHGNEFFDKLDDWFDDLDLGTDMPRSKEVIKRSIVEAVSENPLFEQLQSNSRFISIIERLKNKILG